MVLKWLTPTVCISPQALNLQALSQRGLRWKKMLTLGKERQHGLESTEKLERKGVQECTQTYTDRQTDR